MNDLDFAKLVKKLNSKREEYRARKKEIINVDIQKRIHFAGMIRGYSEVINYIKMIQRNKTNKED